MRGGEQVDAHRQRQRSLVAIAALLASAIGCGGSTAPSTPSPIVTAKSAAAPAFIDDDYARALAEAKEKKKPIFVDAWAPWCHSCLSMRAYVLSDPALAPLANDFVWLAIDTEKDSNAAFTSKLQNRVWPTLWIVDPTTETATMRWEGTATTSELVTLLAAVHPKQARAGADKPAHDDFRRGTELLAKGEVAEAERAFARAMDDDVATRPQATEALIGLVSARKDFRVCSTLASTLGPTLPVGTSRASVLAMGLSCAREAKREAELGLLVEAAEKSARDPDPRMAADDRSALYEELVETKKEKGDDAGSKALAKEWAAFLEGEAKKAPSKSARVVFDAHRLSAYLAADEPARAVPMLQESEKDFPEDYNPPARLAKAYLTMKQLDDARAAIDRAATRVYGPRSLRVFSLSADIAKAKGDVAAERAALEQAILRTKTGPAMNDNQKKLRADLEKRLGALK